MIVMLTKINLKKANSEVINNIVIRVIGKTIASSLTEEESNSL